MFFSKNTKILVLLAEYNVPTLIYKISDPMELEKGTIVEVPFKKKLSLGIILDFDVDCDFDEQKIRFISRKLDLPPLNKGLIELISKSAKYYLGPISSFLKMAIPVKKINLKHEVEQKIDENFCLSKLNRAQEQAYQELAKFSAHNQYSTCLLDGVTGSGKTEVYFNVIRDHILNSDNQILILLPEIILTSQLIEKFKERFNFQPEIWHSAISVAKKNSTWLRIINGSARVVIGTRSALFLPFKKLSLVIVEEEHDGSYKQEDGINYNARDAAILNGFLNKIPIILVSATCSIETFANVINGKYKIVKILSRYNEQDLPKVSICDLRKENMPKGEWISDTVRKAILETLSEGNQALLFLNRRGYAPLILCKICGYRFVCNHCSSWMVEHKARKRLECHHCGKQKSIPSSCPECSAKDTLISCGPGVERIEEEILKIIPSARTILMTKDNIKSINDAKKTIDQITRGDVDIIIGTQLIAKGHHFPKLALVGIIDADAGFNGGDLRAPENNFQLLEQVGGRAGRADTKGEVIIQTYYPENEIIKAISSNDKDNFYLREMQSRSTSNMPPFARFCAIIISATNEEKLQNLANDLVRKAPSSPDLTILGPSASFLAKVKRKFRYRILVKAPKNFDIQGYVNFWFSGIKIPSWSHVKIDIDPYNFM